MNDKENKPILLLLFFSVATILLHLTKLFVEIDHPFFLNFMEKIANTGFFDFFYKPLLIALALIVLFALGSKGMKSESIKPVHSIGLILVGLALYFGAALALSIPGKPGMQIYMGTLFSGYLILLAGLLFIRRIISNNLMNDQFNKKNKLFKQERKRIENPYSVNIKTTDGYINVVNPFRATMVLGTPGSGKSFAIVEEFIHQHIRKGFSMLVYDFKYPDLSRVAYNYFLKYHDNYTVKPKIFIVNFKDCKNSHRINPISPNLVTSLADALATSEALFLNIDKQYIKQQNFFTSSGVNLVTAIIWFLRCFDKGKYCTIPHVIAMLSLTDDVLLAVLETQPDIKPIITPFVDALAKKALAQLAGQTGSAKIPLSRLATKELFWILSGNDFELDINNPEKPCILFLANNPQTQKSYSPVFGLIASTITRVINQKNRLPLSLIIDELPTIYIHGLDNLIATARSNKISTLLSFQDLAQLERDYGREVANTIFNTSGNKITGSVVAETAKKLSDMIGKTVQKRNSLSHNKSGTTSGTTTTMDYLIPPETIAQLSQGEFCGVLSDTFEQKAKQKIFHSKVIADKSGLTRYPIPDLTKMDDEKFQELLDRNLVKINDDIIHISKTCMGNP